METEICIKSNKPLDCIGCNKRDSLTANTTSMTIECPICGKRTYNIGVNSISSQMIINGEDKKCSY